MLVASLMLLLTACSDPELGPPAQDGSSATEAPDDAAPRGGADPEDGDAGADTNGDAPDGDRDAPGGDRDAPDGDRDAPGGDDEDSAGGRTRCAPAVEAGIDDTIAAQLDAFARDDFAGALSYASDAFRDGVDPITFQQLIEQEYALLTAEATHELTACAGGSGRAEVSVAVTAADGRRATFLYRLREEDGRWVIDGAARLTPPPAGT